MKNTNPTKLSWGWYFFFALRQIAIVLKFVDHRKARTTD